MKKLHSLSLHTLSAYSIDQLDVILQNPDHYTQDCVALAKELLIDRLVKWRESNERKVSTLNTIIQKQGWFDFQMWNYDGWNLVVGGGHNLTYSHSLEITFSGTFFVSGFFQSWMSDTDTPVVIFLQGEKEKEIQRRYEVEKYHLLFQMRTEDYKNDIFIAARSLSYETDPTKMIR